MYGFVRGSICVWIFQVPQQSAGFVSDCKSIPLDLEKLPLPQDNNEAALQQMIHELNRMRMEAEEARMTSYREMADYYTMWVHQIKTPIAALRLLLGEQPQENKTALAEVFG